MKLLSQFAINSSLLCLLVSPVYVGDQIEEIIVPVERRESTVQDTALSITAVTGEELDNLGVGDALAPVNFIFDCNSTTSSTSQKWLPKRVTDISCHLSAAYS